MPEQSYRGLATVEVQTATPTVYVGRVSIVPGQEWSGGSVPQILLVRALGETVEINVEGIDPAVPVWTGKRHYFPEDDVRPGTEVRVLVRPTEPADAVSAAGTPRSIPLPVPVLDYLFNVEYSVPKLYALSEDDGFVVTMLLDSDAGLYIRYSGAWHTLVEDAVDGLNVHEVNDAALDLFDQFDRSGQLVHASAMMGPDGLPLDSVPFVGAEPTVPAPAATGVVATAMAVPKLESAADLPDAIAAAAADPDLRWWVERRTKALGLEADLPWSSGAGDSN